MAAHFLQFGCNGFKHRWLYLYDSRCHLHQCHYKVLGIPKTATLKEIKSAYKSLAKEYHPDINKEESESSKFVSINEAYSILSDPVKRRQYDNENVFEIKQQIHKSSTVEQRSMQYNLRSGYYSQSHRFRQNQNVAFKYRSFWIFFAIMLGWAYGSLIYTGKHFLSSEWDRVE